MQDIRIEGIGTIVGGEYCNINIDGIGKCEGDLIAQTIDIDGKFNCNGSVKADTITCDGLTRCNGNIITQNIDIDGKFNGVGSLTTEILNCDGMAEFDSNIIAKTVLVNGLLSVKNGTKIEADQINCDGCIRIDGQISADVIMANGFVNAKEIVGDSITIKSRYRSFIKLFFTKSISEIDLIEATTVQISGVSARSVNGQNVLIGPRCNIKNLDCSGTLSIHPTATIENITGNYTMR